jgi:hypothetical protein
VEFTPGRKKTVDDTKGFNAEAESNSRKTPLRVAFVTRRTSPQVKSPVDDHVMTFPEGLFRAFVAVDVLTLILVLVSLLWNAPLEELANPSQTPNPAKAPWYFLGLQELLHYFPPVVGGVLIPSLLLASLIVIPYFNVNVEATSLWQKNRQPRLRILAIVTAALSIFFIVFEVWASLIPTLVIAAMMFLAGNSLESQGRFRHWLAAKSLSFWIMTWFLVQAIVLTSIGTFFRGAGWAWVSPFSGGI